MMVKMILNYSQLAINISRHSIRILQKKQKIKNVNNIDGIMK